MSKKKEVKEVAVKELPQQIIHKLIGDSLKPVGFVHPVSYKTLECGNCKQVFKADVSFIGATCPECKTRGIIK